MSPRDGNPVSSHAHMQGGLGLGGPDPAGGPRWTACASSTRALMVRNPVMFVVEVGSVLTTLIWLRDLVAPGPGAMPAWFTGQVALWLWFTVLFANFAEALAEGRGKAQAAALRGLRQETVARKLVDGREEAVPASTLRKGDVVVVERRRGDPGRRRGHRRHRLRRRVGRHRRVGARDPRERRRPLRRDRRHARALRPDRGADQRRSRRVVPGPHDRPGRGRQAAEDAQRDRAARAAVGHDDHLPDRLRDAGAVRPLLRPALLGDGDRGAARVPDPDHDRRAALRDRHRGHGPPDPAQRDPDERPRRRGGRRRRHDAARQDRHDHARQPHGHRVRPGPGRARRGAGGRRPAREPRRRDAGRPLDRGAGQGALRPARPRARRTPSATRSCPSRRRRA